jgi:alanine racemase
VAGGSPPGPRDVAPREPIERRLAAAGLPSLPRNAWLELDLEALAANLRLVRELVGPAVLVEPVVKADAYGHGMVPIGRALIAAGADGLCVATFDEAADLRAAGIDARITVLFPIPPERAAAARELGIAIAAGNRDLIDRIVAALGSSEVAGDVTPPLALELEVESGLGRGGVPADEIVAAARTIAESPPVRLTGLWTHLQSSEDPVRTAAQIARFEAASAALAAAGIAVGRRHIAASGGILVPAIPMYDVVRPGLMIYGLAPDEFDPADLPPVVSRLRPVLSLRARPVHVANLPAGYGISYGPTFVTGRPSRIATLPVGYGDGWSRALSNRAEALVRGRRVPIVGNVAMDAVMVDVTDVPGAPVDLDDEFVLIGEQGAERISVLELAQTRTTNSWEVVTAMSRRLPRVYDAPAGLVGVRTLSVVEDRWLGSSSGTAISAI